jgi:hypothetical protein
MGIFWPIPVEKACCFVDNVDHNFFSEFEAIFLSDLRIPDTDYPILSNPK